MVGKKPTHPTLRLCLGWEGGGAWEGWVGTSVCTHHNRALSSTYLNCRAGSMVCRKECEEKNR
jgi:hypothetical protein